MISSIVKTRPQQLRRSGVFLRILENAAQRRRRADPQPWTRPRRMYLSTLTEPVVWNHTDQDSLPLTLDPSHSIPLQSLNSEQFANPKNSLELYLESRGIQSRPKPGGNWNVDDPLGWTKHFGRRSPSEWERLKPLVQLKPGDDGYFPVTAVNEPTTDTTIVEPQQTATPQTQPNSDSGELLRVTIVRTKEQAQIVLKHLYAAPLDTFHACDTEAMAIDLKCQGPVGNGYVTCLSMYSGPNFDYGLGDGPGTCLWIDNLDDACGILQEFKDWFADERYLKVWHNVGFDRHVMWNEGIDVRGLGGDTMHMARLEDTSRAHGTGYSLEALTESLLQRRKKPMKELFGVARKRKDGSDGNLIDIPPVEVLQRDPQYRTKWIQYSALDAKSTFELREKLHGLLLKVPWMGYLEGSKHVVTNLWDYYWIHMRPFAQVLTDMERRGIRVDAKDYLSGVEQTARRDRQNHETVFRHWVAKQYPPHSKAHALALNPASAAQLQTFLFGGSKILKTNEVLPTTRTFRVPRTEIPEDAWQAFCELEEQKKQEDTSNLDEKEVLHHELRQVLDGMSADDLKNQCANYNLKKTGTRAELKSRLEDFLISGGTLAETSVRKATSSMPNPPASTDAASESLSLPTEAEIDAMKVPQLKAKCKELNLKAFSKLKKLELQEFLRSHVRQLAAVEQSNLSAVQQEEEEFRNMSDQDLLDALKARGLPTFGNRKERVDRLVGDILMTAELSSSGITDGDFISGALQTSAKETNPLLAQFLQSLVKTEKKEPKFVDVEVISLNALGKGSLKPIKATEGGAPSVTADVLAKLAGNPFADPPKYGEAFNVIGKEGCEALFSLCAIGSIDTMIATFLTSLQALVDEDSRVHGALNINTDTGRLSSRRPNLQNQPALEKDKYKIRKAFQASPGNNLIVADYGQLELRILASLTNCKSMIEAFEAGGDFHSRTAMDMFDYIRKKVDACEVLLEWDYSKGNPPKPLLKDEFAAERRKAKTLNFSIAYGKTAHGLSQDWGVTKTEAEDMLKKWYDARPEVDKWQKSVKRIARNEGYTRTLMGRYRHLPEATRNDPKLWGHAERASINTPIQGGAADIAMMAMLKINDSQKLKDLGWILLLQIHDEVILEGPEETAEEAFREVVQCMQEPWTFGLKPTAVPLLVDGSCSHKTWYDAK